MASKEEMMLRSIGFGACLPYAAGGAERSLKHVMALSHPFAVLGFRTCPFRSKIRLFSVERIRLLPFVLPTGRWGYSFTLLYFFPLFFVFRRIKCIELHTYGTFSLPALFGFRGRSSNLYIRALSDIGIVEQYERGGSRLLFTLYRVSEEPARLIYLALLRYLVTKRSVRIIANSKFTAKKVKRVLGITAVVEYPYVAVDQLKAEYDYWGTVLKDNKKDRILFIGDGYNKGIDLATRIAERLSDKRFLFVGRRLSSDRTFPRNVERQNWTRYPAELFARASIVIVPSRWAETFGRVAAEATILGVPALVSNRGGLPEAVGDNKDLIVSDLENIEEWCIKIEATL